MDEVTAEGKFEKILRICKYGNSMWKARCKLFLPNIFIDPWEMYSWEEDALQLWNEAESGDQYEMKN